MIRLLEKYAEELNIKVTDAIQRAQQEDLSIIRFDTVARYSRIFNAEEITDNIHRIWVVLPNVDKTGEVVFGFGGFVGLTPCLYQDEGWYEGTGEFSNIRAVKTVEEYEHLRFQDVEHLVHNAYGSRSQGGMRGLYAISESDVQDLRSKNTDIEVQLKMRKQQQQLKAEKDRGNKFAEAKQTGLPVVLDSYMDDCDGSDDECSTDSVVVYAMPDGTKKIKRKHTF